MEFLILLLLILFFLLLHKELRDSSKRTRQDLRRVEERIEQLEGKGSPSESSKEEEKAREASSPSAEVEAKSEPEGSPSTHRSEAEQVKGLGRSSRWGWLDRARASPLDRREPAFVTRRLHSTLGYKVPDQCKPMLDQERAA